MRTRRPKRKSNDGETYLRFTGRFRAVPHLTPADLEQYDGCAVEVVGFVVCHETEHQETLVDVRFLGVSKRGRPFVHHVFLDEVTERI